MIPGFGLDDVLPPFEGDDATGAADLCRSPYQATMSELVDRFGTSRERGAILRGFKAYRDALRASGFATGFQWVNGSFVEACELVKGRPPSDIDVVSLFYRPANLNDVTAWQSFVQRNVQTLFDPQHCKATYLCDSYFIDLNIAADLVATQAAYWFGLFSHQRDTFRWKGLIQLNLQCDDESAMDLLTTKEVGW